MAKGLKGITVEIDGNTEPLNKALRSVNATAKGLQTELKGVNTLLKTDPSNTELQAQKQRILKEAITETTSKLKMLEEAQKQAAAAGKDINDEGYRKLQREIILTKQRLGELKSEQTTFQKLAAGVESFGQKLAAAANKVPLINKLGTAFGNVKTKITEAVSQNEKIQKIGTAVQSAKDKIGGLADKIPVIGKVGKAFEAIGSKVDAIKGKLPPMGTAIKALGSAAATAAKGGWSVLSTTVGGTMKAFAGFTTAAVTAAVAVGKQALTQYADYEQLVGGVETLFGAGGQSLQEYAKSVGKSTTDASGEYQKLQAAQETVIKNADDAFKTAGMSANQYIETVTGFSAALIQSMDGDTEAAAQKADMAITDMADNANKMGSDLSTIQTAYQGFAKGQFTLLDNLKLGYGGTKTEMERLLADAEKISGVKYDISSYADIVDAIHTVQEEMGIAGATADEAMTTISGSTNAAKAAWSNFVGGLANDEADMGALIDDLVSSVTAMIDNILPRVMQIIPSIISVIPQLITSFAGIGQELGTTLRDAVIMILPELITAFFTLIQSAIAILPTLLPQVLSAAMTLFNGILAGLNQTIPQLTAMLPTLITQITTTLTANLPQIITAGIQILTNLINGITQAIPSLISSIVALIPVIVSSLLAALPQIIEAGLNLLIALVTGIVQAIPQLIAMLPQIITSIVSTLLSMLPQIIQAGIQLLMSLIQGIVEAIPQLIAMLPQIISSIINTLITNLPQIISAGIQLLGALVSGLIQAIPQLIAAIPQIIKAIFDTIKAVNWGELGMNIISGIVDGIKNAASMLLDVLMDLAASALGAVKDFFGIQSPSTVMRDQVGKMLPAGMAIGVEEGMDEEEARIKAAMQNGVPTTIDSYMSMQQGKTAAATQATSSGYVQNVTINSPQQLSPSEVARQTRNATRQMVLKLKPT